MFLPRRVSFLVLLEWIQGIHFATVGESEPLPRSSYVVILLGDTATRRVLVKRDNSSLFK